MRVPLGNFGGVVAQAGPAADTSAIGAALERAGATLGRVEDERRQRRQAVDRVRAYNALAERDTAIKAKRQELREAVRSGRVDESSARSELESFLEGGLQPWKSGSRLPDLDTRKLDPETREAVEAQTRLQRARSLVDFDGELAGLFSERAATEGQRGFAALADRAAEGEDPAALEQSADAIASALAVAGVPPETVAAARDQAKQRAWRAHVDRRAQASRNDPEALRQLQRDLTASDGAFAGKLTADDRSRLTRQVLADMDRLEEEARRAFEAAAREQAQEAERVAIENMLLGRMPLDPKNSEHRKYADTLFAGWARDGGLDPSSPLQGAQLGADGFSGPWFQLATDLTQRTRVMPRQVEGFLRQSVRSPNGAVLRAGARLFEQIDAAAPEAIGQLDEDTKAALGMASSMLRAGGDSERVAQTVRQVIYDAPRELIERRRADYRTKAEDNAGALNDYIDRDFDPGLLARQPAASQMLSADFDAQTRRYFERTGDIDLARDLAWADLSRVYGPSTVNGEPVVMPMPPERFGVEPADVRAEIAEILNANPQADGSTAADVLVVPDLLTLRMVRDAYSGRPLRPSYSLVTKSGDLVVDRTGVPLRFTVPDAEGLRRRHEARQQAAEAEAMGRARSAQQQAADASEAARRAAAQSQQVSPQLRGR